MSGINSPENQITIAITVYDRREFIEQAIESALSQTFPAKVIVVEDCGPDDTLQAFVTSRFGDRITYIRNAERRGLFDNWNACLNQCDTPWLSILHDDDYLRPNFVETMLELRKAAPENSLYFGNLVVIDRAGRVIPFGQRPAGSNWQQIDLNQLADRNTLGFAGHLVRADSVRAVGGFRPHSRYCGDWEMWFKLVSAFGGVQTDKEVVVVRYYEDWRKGTSKVNRTGEDTVATNVQRKRNYAHLLKLGRVQMVDKRILRDKTGMTLEHLLWFGAGFSPRMLKYNVGVFLTNRPRSIRQRLLQLLISVFGPGSVRLVSRCFAIFRSDRGSKMAD